MSLVKIEEVPYNPEDNSSEDEHRHPFNLLNTSAMNNSMELMELRAIVREKDYLISSLERENNFLREQVKTLNTLLDQLAVSTRNLASKNDIRIKVENSSGVSLKKWYRKPKLVLAGGAFAVFFSVYLRYKIKHW